MTLKPVLDDTDFKKTVKLTWLADVPQNVPAVAVHHDNIISKAVLGKNISLILSLFFLNVSFDGNKGAGRLGGGGLGGGRPSLYISSYLIQSLNKGG